MERILPIRTKVFNFFRQVFKISFLEKVLVSLSKGKNPDSFIAKLIPSNYLYHKGSNRIVIRNGIKYSLDISDFIDWTIYFNLYDASHESLLSLSNDYSIIFDIGTNNGSVLMRMCKVANNGFVYGFEPDTVNYQRCVKNLSLNDFKNYKIFNKGLGEQDENVFLSITDSSNLGMNKITHDVSNGNKVEITSVDFIVDSHKIGLLNLIKIDTEGYEFKVLKGAENTLLKFKPILFIELDDNNLREQGNSAFQLVNFLINEFSYKIKAADSGMNITTSLNFDNCHFDIIAQ